ncbi:Predicted phage phi-C31 gp36 major capsid-like protein [uncultured Clostridium sp.]|nr:Predicted phage phi-C31 gp36 major capsid-like protein [uncultured Clostridium sp.]
MNKKMRELYNKINTLNAQSKELKSNGETAKAYDLAEYALLLKKEFEEEEKRFKEEKDLNCPNNIGLNKNNSIIKGAIYPGEKYKRDLYESKKDLDFGKLVKGMVKGQWENAENERDYISKNMTSTGSVLIPDVLADKIVDMARTNSAIFGNVPVVQMPHNNLTVAIQTGDATASFVREGDAIPDSDIIFDKVSLNGKTLAIYVPVSEKLLDSAPNLSEQLIHSVTQAIGLGLDKAMLYGQGVTEDVEEIKGICNIDGINKVESSVSNVNYDFVIQGTSPIRKANITPTNIVYNTSFADELSLLKDTDGNYVNRPSFCDKYIFNESNNIKDNQVLCYDVNSLLLGIHTDIRMDWGYINDDFKRIQKGLRIYLRADFVPVRPKGVSLVTINKQ